jgi:hypothetical protein
MVRLLFDEARECGFLLPVGITVVLVELICLTATWRAVRKEAHTATDSRPGSHRWSWVASYLALVAVLASLLLAAAAVWSVEDARATILSLRMDHSIRMKDQIAVFAVALFFAIPSWLMAAITCSLAVAIRQGERRGLHTRLAGHYVGQTILFFCLGALPWLIGVLGYALQIERSSLAVAGLPPEDKQAPFWQAWQAAKSFLGSWSLASAIGAGLAAILSTGALLRTRSNGADAGATSRTKARWLAGSAACLAGVVVCLVLARPYRAENLEPWPESALCAPALPPSSARPGSGGMTDVVSIRLGQGERWAEIPSCALPWPYPHMLVPDIWIGKDDIRVYGSRLDSKDTVDDLVSARRMSAFLHPGEAGDQASLWAPPLTPSARLTPLFGQLTAAGFKAIHLGCGRVTLHRRPTLGLLARACLTGLRVDLRGAEHALPPSRQNVVELDPADYANYGLLFAEALNATRLGQGVALATTPQPE